MRNDIGPSASQGRGFAVDTRGKIGGGTDEWRDKARECFQSGTAEVREAGGKMKRIIIAAAALTLATAVQANPSDP